MLGNTGMQLSGSVVAGWRDLLADQRSVHSVVKYVTQICRYAVNGNFADEPTVGQ